MKVQNAHRQFFFVTDVDTPGELYGSLNNNKAYLEGKSFQDF